MRARRHLLQRFLRDQRGDFAAGFAKSAIAIAFLAVLAANVVSRHVEPLEQDRLAQIAARAAKEQNVDRGPTGSLARSVASTKVDPCALPPR